MQLCRGGIQGAGWFWAEGESWTVHRPLVRLRGPVRIMRSLEVTVTLSASNCTEQPLSQSWLTDSRAPDLRLGKMWARRASSGKLGSERRAVCVEWIWLPSGSVTDRGQLARFRFVQTLV